MTLEDTEVLDAPAPEETAPALPAPQETPPEAAAPEAEDDSAPEAEGEAQEAEAEGEALPGTDPSILASANVTRGREIYGLVDVAGCRLAIRALHIREAVPFPEALSPLAVCSPGLIGAMVLRQDTIPLIDTATLLGSTSTRPMSERVVIVMVDSAHNRVLGLVVDSLQGMTALDESQIARMGLIGQSDLLAGGRSFVMDGQVVGLFDPQILFDRPSLPFALQRDRQDTRGSGLFGGQQAFLLCAIQSHGLAIPVEAIHATIPMQELKASPMAHRPCDGVIEHHGLDIPILDTLQLLGIGRNFSRPARSASVALRVPGGGFISLEIDGFFDIVHTPKEELLEIPQVMSQRTDLFSGIYMSPEGKHFLVMNCEALVREEIVVQLASTTVKDAEAMAEEIAKDGEKPGADRTTPRGPAELYLVSTSAQKRMACRLLDIIEILHLPESLLYAEVRHDGYMGTLSHRRQLVPIFSVPNVLGEFPFFEEGKACVMLFRLEGQMFGAVVEDLVEVTRCQTIGTAADKMLRKVDGGAFVPLFDVKTELPTTGGQILDAGFNDGFSELF